MTFAIETPTKAKLTEIGVLSQKNREEDENPGVQLAFSQQLPNSALAMLDGSLQSFLYTRTAASSTSGQAALEGVEPVSDLPNLTTIGKLVGRLHWNVELTGFTLVIDHGMGGASNIEITDCVLSKFRISPQEGGTVLLDFQLESSDVAANVFGKLATLKNRDVEITLAPPEVSQQEIEQPKQKPRTKATGKAAAAGDGVQPDGSWPFKDGTKPGDELTPESALAAAVK